MTDPVAFQIGRLSIRWYGIFVALGFLAGYHLIQRRARRLGLPVQAAPDVALAAMVGGIAGARILYVVQNWSEEFSATPLDALAVWHGGLVFYGGFLGALITVVCWSLRQRWPLLTVGDMAAPGLALGHAFGRIGCFLNGCCFGYPAAGALGVTYPGLTRDGYINGPLHVQRLLGEVAPDATVCVPVFPIQLVEAAGNLLLCGLLLGLDRRPALRGRLFPLYLLLYAILRFLVEFARGDYLSRSAGLTSAQWLCLVLFLAAIVWLVWNPGAPPRLQAGDTAERGTHERH
mgnify:CR=1 FL=1